MNEYLFLFIHILSNIHFKVNIIIQCKIKELLIVYNILCKQKSQEKLKKKDIEKRDS